jgi:methyl-accepting chemotaxis protein
MPERSGQDELAQLINAVTKMNQGLSHLVQNIRTGAENVNNIAHHIHNENAELANRTETQAGSLQQTATSVEELTSTVKENAGNLAQASSLANTSAEHVQQGLQVMDKAIVSMQSVIRYAQNCGNYRCDGWYCISDQYPCAQRRS